MHSKEYLNQKAPSRIAYFFILAGMLSISLASARAMTFAEAEKTGTPEAFAQFLAETPNDPRAKDAAFQLRTYFEIAKGNFDAKEMERAFALFPDKTTTYAASAKDSIGEVRQFSKAIGSHASKDGVDLKANKLLG